jgi:hypothetical protein
MSLLSDLERAAELIDPQFQPSAAKSQGVLASLVYYVEHGDELFKAAEGGLEKVTELLQPEPPKQEGPAAVADPAAASADPSAPAPASPVGETIPAATPTPPAADTPADPVDSSLSDDQLAAKIADLEAIQASRRATAGQTTVEHETGAPAPPAADPAPPSSAADPSAPAPWTGS